MKDSIFIDIKNSIEKLASNSEVIPFYEDFNFWFGVVNIIGIISIILTLYWDFYKDKKPLLFIMNLSHRPLGHTQDGKEKEEVYKLTLAVFNASHSPIIINSVTLGYMNDEDIVANKNGNVGEFFVKTNGEKSIELYCQNIDKINTKEENIKDLTLRISLINNRGYFSKILVNLEELRTSLNIEENRFITKNTNKVIPIKFKKKEVNFFGKPNIREYTLKP